MNSSLALGFSDLLSRLPLSLLHRLGALAGWLSYKGSKSYAARLHDNLKNAYRDLPEADFQRLLRANVAETGKAATELLWMWRRPLAQVIASVVECRGQELLQGPHPSGLIIMTPHIGCFDVITHYVSATMPMTCMYRVPKLAWLDQVMRAGRERGQSKLARADLGGVRTLLKALKRGEAIGVLPDQAPGNGEGEWAPFFGLPAYTMTLAGRLTQASGATVLLCHAVRLPKGAGYRLRFSPLPAAATASAPLNAALEDVIRTCPEQYLWAYNRYKTPQGSAKKGQ